MMSGEQTTLVEEIFAEYGRDMKLRASRILGSDADAEDAVQETLLTVLQGPHLLSGIERLRGWLYTVVRRRSIDIIRKDVRRKDRESEVGLDDLFEHDDPYELMEQEEFAEAVASIVRSLPDSQRDAFVNNALEMKTFKEISDESGVPMGTLMARKKRAVDTIRARLNELGFAV